MIGASDRTGRIVVKDALACRHNDIAVTRTDAMSEPDDDQLINARELAVTSALPPDPVDTRPLAKGRTTTYRELATAPLDSLTRQDLYRHAPTSPISGHR